MRLTTVGNFRRRRPVALAAAALLGGAALVAIAAAAGPDRAESGPERSPTNPEAVALAQARATGRSVPVAADTTAYASTVANPNGSFTLTSHVAPTQVRRGAGWVPVDASLHAAADGSLIPAAVESSVRLSGGGRGPLVSLDDGAGHRLAVSMSMPLPRPATVGDTATYASVLSGVDLSVTVTSSGGIREVLVVHDAQAAANPALANLRLGLATTGLTLSTGVGGAIAATDPVTGVVVFGAPAPVMWDSTRPVGTSSTDRSATTVDGDRLSSGVTGPGTAAMLTPVPVALTPGALTLTPPAAALTGAGVTYPVYLDPAFGPGAVHDGYIQSMHPTTVSYDPTDDLKVGFDDWNTNCGNPCYKNGVTRTYLAYTGLGGLAGKYIDGALLTLNQIATSCGGNPDGINVAVTNNNAGFGSATTWNNAPPASSITGFGNLARGSGSRQIDLRNTMQYGPADRGWGTLNLVMWAANEGDHCVYRHFSLNPVIAVTYWSTPNTPAGLAVQNGSQSYPCNSTSPGAWVPAASGNQVALTYSVSTPDANTDLTGHLYLSTDGGAASDLASGAHEGSANQAVPISTAIAVTDGRTYAFNAAATNAFRASPTSATCYFRYDGAAPATPVVSSTAYPAAGPTTVPVGGSGVISWSAIDAGSGVATYNYNLNGASLTSAGEQSTSATSVTVALSTLHWGTNTLWLQAIDGAGNSSGVVAYAFFIQQSAFGAYTPGTAGDLDADNFPDLVTVDTTGAVRLFTNPDTANVNPTGDAHGFVPNPFGGRVLIPASSNARWPIPDSASAAGALITHAGSFAGNNYDDLIVEQNGHLAVATNPGTTGPWTFATTDIPKPPCATCTGYNDQDWSSVIQMIAVPVGPAARPNLLTVEQNNGAATLWLYPALAGSYAYNAPTMISTYTTGWHWDDVQLLGAGPLPGSAGSTLWTRDPASGALFIFHNLQAGLPDPVSVRIQVGDASYTGAAYPLITTIGRADSSGDLPLWATDASGRFTVLPTRTTTAGVTTIGSPVVRGVTGWANREIALGSAYQPYNNSGIGFDASSNTPFDTATANAYSLSVNALATATLSSGTTVNGGPGTCPTGWTTCAASLGGANTLSVHRASGNVNSFILPAPWAHRSDNYQAAGQVLPVPTPNTNGPAHSITFLGASATGDAVNGASADATITYTDGNIQAITITLADWTKAPVAGDIVVATMDHRLVSATGAFDGTDNYLFASPEIQLLDIGNPLPAGVQIASITLSTNAAVHIFSIAVN